MASMSGNLRKLAIVFAAQMFDRAADLRDCIAPHIMNRPRKAGQSRRKLILEAPKKDKP
jgi:hypothetical protein